jgi:hypothetical protein
MIALIFTFAGAGLLVFQVFTYDVFLAYLALSRDIEATLGHDTNIFPDHTP